MKDNDFWILLAKHTVGEIKLHESEQLQTMIDNNEWYKEVTEFMNQCWQDNQQQEEVNVEIAWLNWKNQQRKG